jgi:hypothetical protein
MRTVHKYQAHPWGRSVWMTQDPSALRILAKRFQLSLEDLTTSEGLCWETQGPTVIWVSPGSGVDVLVHECTHATLDILEYAGINAHAAEGEPMCYTLQRMVSAFLPHLQSTQNS